MSVSRSILCHTPGYVSALCLYAAGTEANKERKYEQGDSYGSGTGSGSGYGTSSGTGTGSGTGGVASKIPGEQWLSSCHECVAKPAFAGPFLGSFYDRETQRLGCGELV